MQIRAATVPACGVAPGPLSVVSAAIWLLVIVAIIQFIEGLKQKKKGIVSPIRPSFNLLDSLLQEKRKHCHVRPEDLQDQAEVC